MKNPLLLIVVMFVLLSGTKAGDLNAEIVDLAKIYRNFMFMNEPTSSTFKQLELIQSEELAITTKFITAAISTDNDLATLEFLKIPEDQTLKFIFIVRKVNWNIREEDPRDNEELIAEIMEEDISRYEIVNSYYDMLFAGVGNKNKPFDLSEMNFEIFSYGLQDETEEGIFFLNAMDLCGMMIWGYMNVVKPPNYKLALQYINKYTKFNGQTYFQYLDFGFMDFDLVIDKDKGKESYKYYYIDKYYNTLLSHLECLSQKKKQDKARTELLLGSILKEKNYYKYSKKKKGLESLFTSMKR